MQASQLLQRLDEIGDRPGQPIIDRGPDHYYWQVPIDDQMYNFEADREGKYGNDWYIVFSDSWRSYTMTSIGHKTAVKVISTLGHFIQALRRAKQPETLLFSASGDSRQRLYERLIRQLVLKSPGAYWDYKDRGYTRDYFVVFPTSSTEEAYQVNEIGQQYQDWFATGRMRQARYAKGHYWDIPIDGQLYVFYVELSGGHGRPLQAEIMFTDAEGSMHVTNIGHKTAVKVFAAAGHFLQQVRHLYKPDVIRFTGGGKSRRKLYAHLAKRLAAGIPGATVQGSLGTFDVVMPGVTIRPQDANVIDAVWEPEDESHPLLRRLGQSLDEMGSLQWRPQAHITRGYGEYRWEISIEGTLYKFSATEEDPHEWYVMFSRPGTSNPYGQVPVGHKTATKVVSVLMAFMQNFIRTEEPEVLVFSALGDSRIALYDHLVRKLVRGITGAEVRTKWGRDGDKIYTIVLHRDDED